VIFDAADNPLTLGVIQTVLRQMLHGKLAGGWDVVLIIGGHPRSGTTLLTRLCNSHPEIVLTNEFGYFYGLGEKTYAEQSRLLLRELWEKIRDRHVWDYDMYAFVLGYLTRTRKYRHGFIDLAAIEATLRAIWPQASIVGDKAAGYVFELSRLAAARGLSCIIIYATAGTLRGQPLKVFVQNGGRVLGHRRLIRRKRLLGAGFDRLK
jgi:hypothetical protein